MNYTECCRSCLEPDTSSAKLLTDFTVRSLYEDCSRLTVITFLYRNNYNDRNKVNKLFFR